MSTFFHIGPMNKLGNRTLKNSLTHTLVDSVEVWLQPSRGTVLPRFFGHNRYCAYGLITIIGALQIMMMMMMMMMNEWMRSNVSGWQLLIPPLRPANQFTTFLQQATMTTPEFPNKIYLQQGSSDAGSSGQVSVSFSRCHVIARLFICVILVDGISYCKVAAVCIRNIFTRY